jgi:hypothetical protein
MTNSAGTTSSGDLGGGGGSGPSSGGTGGVVESDCAVPFAASGDDNYGLESQFVIQATSVKPSSEIFFDWSAVSADFLGHAVGPADVGMVEIALWNLTLEQFEAKFNSDALTQTDLAIIGTILPSTPTTTTGSIYDLTETGQPLDRSMIDPYLDIGNYPAQNHIYTALVASGTNLGKGTRMLQAFRLDASSTNTDVDIASDSTTLSLSVDLHSLHALGVPTNTPRIVVDWNNLQTTAQGEPFDPSQITEVRVARYSKSRTELEQRENFTNLDTIADELYSSEVLIGTSFDLSRTRDATGKYFSGIDASGTWLLALNCGDCANPAPWYMTVLTACGQSQTQCLKTAPDTCGGGICGDGVVTPGEACDMGAANDGSYGGCNPDCTIGPRCGDGIVQSNEGEQCEPPGTGRCGPDCILL